jgi:hypothetical protein
MAPATAKRTARRRIGILAALALALGLGAAAVMPRLAAGIDPCYGYDLCVHLSVVAMGRAGENGDGWVTSEPSGISCRFVGGQPETGSSTCDHYFHANFVSSISVTLNAAADAGNTVICDFHVTTGERTCSDGLQFGSSTTTAYSFDFTHDPVTVTVGNAGQPGGFVYSTPMGIDCGETYTGCSHSWPWGTNLLLYAEGDNGGGFVSWTGACAGNNESCELLLQHDISTTAIFAFPATPTPTRTPKPSLGPGPTHTAAPPATPHPSAPAPSQLVPAPSTARTTSAPQATVSAPGSSGVPSPSAVLPAAPTSLDVAVAGTPGPSSAGTPEVVPAGSSNSSLDVLPIVIAIVVGSGLIALGIVGAAAVLRRGRAVPR